MGLLDDAIRQHLELKRQHGADPTEVAELEREAFGPAPTTPAPLELPPRRVEQVEAEVGPEPGEAPTRVERAEHVEHVAEPQPVHDEPAWDDEDVDVHDHDHPHGAVAMPELDPDATTAFSPDEVAEAQQHHQQHDAEAPPPASGPRRWFGRRQGD